MALVAMPQLPRPAGPSERPTVSPRGEEQGVVSGTHTPRLTRPTAYEVAYICTCEWSSDVVPSEELGRIGAQLVRHMVETGRRK